MFVLILTSTASEVNLGLEGEESECEGYSHRRPQRHQHRVCGVEGGDGPQHEALTHYETKNMSQYHHPPPWDESK